MIVPQVRIALPGKSAFSTEPRDYAFNSLYATARIFMDAKVSVTVNANSYSTITVAHNLGFVPMAMLYCEFAPGHYYYGVGLANIVDGFPNGYISISANSAETYVDTTNLVFRIVNTTGSNRTLNYHYYIFADDGI
jgi:hypothetical protein